MNDYESKAASLVQRVMRERRAEPAPAEPETEGFVDAKAYAAEQIRPMREFMAQVSQQLSAARSFAMVSDPIVDDRHSPIRQEEYLLTSNKGEHRTLCISFGFVNPGYIPSVSVSGWDTEAASEFQKLRMPANGNLVLPHSAPQIVDLIERYLGRFLVGAASQT